MNLAVVFEGVAAMAERLINTFDGWVQVFPVSFAFGAGMLASVNPCGFIMLPAFSAFYLTTEAPVAQGWAQRTARALQMSALVTLAFIVTFASAGVIATLAGQALVRWSAWAGLLVGGGLVALGVAQLVGRRSFLTPATSRIRLGRSRSAWGAIAFGLAYAVVSLGCTLPIFMAVVGASLTGSEGIGTAARRYVEYSAGMGLVLLVVALGTAVAGAPAFMLAGRAGRVVETAGNAMLVVAGSYVAWYWGGVVS